MEIKKNKDIWNEKMLQIMDEIVASSSYPKITSRRQYLKSIDFEPNNFPKVENGRSGFRIEHIINCSKKYNVNVYWLLGMERTKYRKSN